MRAGIIIASAPIGGIAVAAWGMSRVRESDEAFAQPFGDLVESPAAANLIGGEGSQGSDRLPKDVIARRHGEAL
jgi:hypothetical protein